MRLKDKVAIVTGAVSGIDRMLRRPAVRKVLERGQSRLLQA